MKRIDYFLPGILFKITGVVFLTQLLIEVGGIAQRKPGFEWVIYACGGAFLASCVYLIVALVLNALVETKQLGKSNGYQKTEND